MTLLTSTFPKKVGRSQIQSVGFLVNLSALAKREAQEFFVNLSLRAKREAIRIVVNLRAKREADGINIT